MKIITAIGNTYINNKLRENNNYEVIGRDIQYQEGILELLDIQEEIDMIILSNNLPGEMRFEELINKIVSLKKVKEMVIFLKEKNNEIEQFLNSKKIYKIYYLNTNNYDIFFNNFCENIKKSTVQITTEIREFKGLILKNNPVIFYENNKKYNGKIIVVSGNYSSGKSIFSYILSTVIEDKKIMIIDLDEVNSIHTVLRIENNTSQIAINSNVYILSKLSILKMEEYRILELLDDLKNKFDFIIIDISINLKKSIIQLILRKADKIIFLIVPDILEIKKSKFLLEIYEWDWKISKNKIKIIFNKVNKYAISNDFINDFFDKYEILGSIEYDEKYTFFINEKDFMISDKNEYKSIYKKLYKEEKCLN